VKKNRNRIGTIQNMARDLLIPVIYKNYTYDVVDIVWKNRGRVRIAIGWNVQVRTMDHMRKLRKLNGSI